MDKDVVNNRLTLPLSCLGLVGLTALLGIRVKGNVKYGGNQVMVISGAGGAVGTLAGQIAK